MICARGGPAKIGSSGPREPLISSRVRFVARALILPGRGLPTVLVVIGPFGIAHPRVIISSQKGYRARQPSARSLRMSNKKCKSEAVSAVRRSRDLIASKTSGVLVRLGVARLEMENERHSSRNHTLAEILESDLTLEKPLS